MDYAFRVSLALSLPVTKSMEISLDKSVKNSIVGSQVFVQSNYFLVVQVSLFIVFLLSFIFIHHKLSGRVTRNTRDLEKVKVFLKECVDFAESKDMRCSKSEVKYFGN